MDNNNKLSYDSTFLPCFSAIHAAIDQLDELGISLIAGDKLCADFAHAYVNLVMSVLKHYKLL